MAHYESKSGIVGIEDAVLTFRNFSGKASQWNREGDRNFNLDLNDEDAEFLKDHGFNVRDKVRPNSSETKHYLAVKVSYKYRPPKILRYGNGKRDEITEDIVNQLDYDDIAKTDVTIRPYHWYRPDGSEGISAYLNSMYVTLVDDPFAGKYADPDGATVEDGEESPF